MQQCLAERHLVPTVIAVDFALRGDLLSTVRLPEPGDGQVASRGGRGFERLEPQRDRRGKGGSAGVGPGRIGFDAPDDPHHPSTADDHSLEPPQPRRVA